MRRSFVKIGSFAAFAGVDTTAGAAFVEKNCGKRGFFYGVSVGWLSWGFTIFRDQAASEEGSK